MAAETSGLIKHYRKEKGERAEARLENLNELVTAARRFEDRLAREPDPEDKYRDSPLAIFVRHTMLEAGEGQADEREDSVQLMTLHAAKGLAFPAVFLCGMEEGLFPQPALAREPRPARGGTPALPHERGELAAEPHGDLSQPLAVPARDPVRAGRECAARRPPGEPGSRRGPVGPEQRRKVGRWRLRRRGGRGERARGRRPCLRARPAGSPRQVRRRGTEGKGSRAPVRIV